MSYVYDDYKELAFGEAPKKYEIGEAAHLADKALPKSFEAHKLWLKTDQDCWVSFNAPGRLLHKIESADGWVEIDLRVRVLWCTRVSTDGTLKIRAFG